MVIISRIIKKSCIIKNNKIINLNDNYIETINSLLLLNNESKKYKIFNKLLRYKI
jgi:hypothetical protein